MIKNSGIYRFNTEISVGYSGFSNSLVVADAGSLISSNGLTGSANAAKIFVGRVVNSTGANPSTNYACDNNWMIISNGATVLCGPMFIGYPNPTSRATNNSVTIGGGNGSSVLAASVGIYVGVGTNAGFTGVGKGATNNYLLLKAGGIITPMPIALRFTPTQTARYSSKQTVRLSMTMDSWLPTICPTKQTPPAPAAA